MFEDYLEAHSINSEFKAHQLGKVIQPYLDHSQLDHAKMALLCVNDGRPSTGNESSSLGPENIYQQLLELSSNINNGDIIDLGSIKAGATFNDTLHAVHEVCKAMVDHEVIPVLLGGSRDILLAAYMSLEGVSNNIDVTHVGAELPFGENEILSKICAYEPNYLFNMNLLGFQGHYAPPKSLDILHEMGFEHMRLGTLKANLSDAEPLIRNTNLFAFDIGGVKQSDAPGNYNANPIGLDGDMACQLCWYAGLSDVTKTFALFEYNPELDQRSQTSKLAALMTWYFIDGVCQRKSDHPSLHNEFMRYRCNLNGNYPDIVFHKSKRTDRWWMELPHPKSLNNKDKNVMIPCSYADYQASAKGDLPERYLRALQKMH